MRFAGVCAVVVQHAMSASAHAGVKASLASTYKEDKRDCCPRSPSSHSAHWTTFVIRLPYLRSVHGPKMRATQRRDD